MERRDLRVSMCIEFLVYFVSFLEDLLILLGHFLYLVKIVF